MTEVDQLFDDLINEKEIEEEEKKKEKDDENVSVELFVQRGKKVWQSAVFKTRK